MTEGTRAALLSWFEADAPAGSLTDAEAGPAKQTTPLQTVATVSRDGQKV